MSLLRLPSSAIDIRGQGQPVVMVHGLGGTLNVWEPQVRALSFEYQTVRFDLRGSGRHPSEGPLSVEAWAEDLAGLMDELHFERAHLIGHSLGTLVVQTYAARNLERVASMSLIGVNRAPPDARREAVRRRAAEVRSNGIASVVDGLLDSVPAPRTRSEQPVVMAAIREMIIGQSDEGYAATCESMAASTRPDLHAYAGPMLLIAGEQDTVSPPDLSRAMAAEFKSAELLVLPDCGHWIPLEQAAAVNAALASFLRRTGASACQ